MRTPREPKREPRDPTVRATTQAMRDEKFRQQCSDWTAETIRLVPPNKRSPSSR
jgi:hypothetical protein